jgi:cell division protein FtsX
MGQTRLLQDLRLPLQLLMATVGLILLITCSNIANLLLARASTRQREIAVRIASGAGRMRLVRQLLTESLLLSGLGGTAGLALARVLSGLLAGFAPPDDFRQVTLDSRLDLRVLGFAVGLSLLTGIVFGLAPALIASRPDLVPALKDEMALPGKRRRRLNLRKVLVMAQVALSLVVLVGAGLCIRSLRNLQSIDTGFETSKVLTMSVDVGLSGYSNDRGMQFYSRLADRVRALRGVEAVSVAALVR